MVKESMNSKDAALKKQRKKFNSSSEMGKPEEDTYKKLVEFEENEASKRSPTKDAELYFQTCQTIRQLLREISALKLQNSAEANAKIAEKKVEACMQVCVLKKLNRLEKFRTKAGRDSLHKEKLQTDSTKLQLQNLLYELTYLKKEISKCFQFRSLDEEIELVSEEEFYKNAPESVTKPDVTNTDKHQLQLSRLQWELQQRKQLASQCRQLETEKEKVAAQIVSKQERLDKLAPQLNQILEATKPLQEQLGVTTDKVREEHQLAYLLPNPLYLLYTKVDAYTQVYDKNITVHIVGEEEEAKQLKKEDEEVPVQYTPDSDSDADIDMSEETAERQKRHHRKSSRLSETRETKQSRLLASYPLCVRIEINLRDEKRFKLILDFYYKIKLHVITVKCQVDSPEIISGYSTGEVLAPQNMLRELFPNDTGKESPNPTNHYQLQQVGLGNFQFMDQAGPPYNLVMGFPYLWAQRVCGLDFITAKSEADPPTPSTQLSQTSVESVMKVLTRRFRSRISLAVQIQQLERNVVPNVPELYNVPLKLNASLTSWLSISWAEYRQVASTDCLVSANVVSESDMFYKCTIGRNGHTLNGFIAVKNNFPEEKSIFSIQIDGKLDSIKSTQLRDMERAINTDWPEEKEKKYKTWLLSAQIRRMVSCFDIYLEVTYPELFSQESIFFSATRGRTRSHPYKYLKVGGGVYTQY